VVAEVDIREQRSPVAVGSKLKVARTIKGKAPKEPVVLQLGSLGDSSSPGLLRYGRTYLLFLGKQGDGDPRTFFVKGGVEGIFVEEAGELLGMGRFLQELEPGRASLAGLERKVKALLR